MKLNKRALSAKIQTRMPLVLKEKKLQLKISAFNRFASKWVCGETSLCRKGSGEKICNEAKSSVPKNNLIHTFQVALIQ